MIYILDNNGEFSDHCIAFVETGIPRRLMESLACEMRRYPAPCVGWKVVGAAPEIEWWVGGAVSLVEWVDVDCLVHIDPLTRQVGPNKALLDLMPSSVWETVIAAPGKIVTPAEVACVRAYLAHAFLRDVFPNAGEYVEVATDRPAWRCPHPGPNPQAVEAIPSMQDLADLASMSMSVEVVLLRRYAREGKAEFLAGKCSCGRVYFAPLADTP